MSTPLGKKIRNTALFSLLMIPIVILAFSLNKTPDLDKQELVEIIKDHIDHLVISGTWHENSTSPNPLPSRAAVLKLLEGCEPVHPAERLTTSMQVLKLNISSPHFSIDASIDKASARDGLFVVITANGDINGRGRYYYPDSIQNLKE